MSSPTKPILFSGPMICALIEGRKTQTRRIVEWVPRDTGADLGSPEMRPIKLCTNRTPPGVWLLEARNGSGDWVEHARMQTYAPGHLLWVRETWCEGPIGRDGVVEDWREYFYRATDHDVMGIDDGDGFSVLNADGSLRSPWRPSIHMPRRASRLTLEVTDVRVERLQDISEEDAIAEGQPASSANSPRVWFMTLWDSLNAKRGFGWDVNPWVVAVTFKPHAANVDALLSQREAA